jgi:hypothetical protein
MIPFSVFSLMLVAQGLDPTAFPQFSPLAADLASMEGFPLGGFNALANSIICMAYMDTQSAKLFFHLQDFKLEPAFLLELGDLKKSFNRMSFICEHARAGVLLSVRLSGGWQSRCRRLAEEPHLRPGL